VTAPGREDLLHVDGLRLRIGEGKPQSEVLRGVRLRIREHANLGIVGESGSGKSLTALTALRELPRSARVAGGQILYRGRNVLQLKGDALRRFRGREVAMVFQNATSALNPVFPIGRQIADLLRIHRRLGRSESERQATTLLDAMGMPDPPRQARAYPHELSGGMAQRALVGMALACAPRLLVADEPTTGLDLTIEAQVLDLIADQTARSGTTVALISHDIDVVAELCSDLAVMYAGEVVESGSRGQVLERPAHPYTRALLACSRPPAVRGQPLPSIPGQVPNLREPIIGCPFAPRCPTATDQCRVEAPTLREVSPGHLAACHYAAEERVA
jgi:peptide/nickel transport system ATP-binding protein